MYTNSGVQAYRETDVNSMSREKIIVLLYEKIVGNLNGARTAVERGDRVAMTQRANHSQRIISELRNALDHNIGGEISRNLEALYDFMFHQHLELLVDQDPLHIDNCLRVIAPLLEAWRAVPIGTGEQAARDHAQGRLKTPGGPDPASQAGGPSTTDTAAANFQPDSTVPVVTGELAAVLNDGQLSACSDLLTRRGAIMAEFQVVHEAATGAERTACRDLLRELAARDRKLLAAAEAALTAAGGAMRSSLGSTAHSRGRYDHAPETACVDRKA